MSTNYEQYIYIPVSNPKKCHFLHFFGHIEIHRNLKTSKRPFKLKQSNKVSFLGATLKKNQIASVGVSMFFYVTKKTSKKKKSGCNGEHDSNYLQGRTAKKEHNYLCHIYLMCHFHFMISVYYKKYLCVIADDSKVYKWCEYIKKN